MLLAAPFHFLPTVLFLHLLLFSSSRLSETGMLVFLKNEFLKACYVRIHGSKNLLPGHRDSLREVLGLF